jgi:hypothetical protein
MEGMQRVQERITNGFRLFGKYYENLWDWYEQCNWS